MDISINTSMKLLMPRRILRMMFLGFCMLVAGCSKGGDRGRMRLKCLARKKSLLFLPGRCWS
ncbi:hypothetical protein M2105_005213 [Paenibacillus sp. PastF-1]|nr:hypothetical protein [Paenibacillus sp. PastF-2]MDF9850763.1 hypothetical protein [Paenibacillus sp. PastM-2]MDF9857333.1 hypothetical protein [Paenibacillus sp. PastF-1]MDH6482559.1 hypothetical protein [Paenibacillus sp. PastH-2]MDH6509987.1 hypothetical protein [Paenibacillus sp. PastM-3]